MDCEHVWICDGTYLVPPTIQMECEKCKARGSTTKFSDDEWKRAFYASINPFQWKGEVEVIAKVVPTIGWSDFALKHSVEGSGNSYTTDIDEAMGLVKKCWDLRIPGAGESSVDRKALVPVPNDSDIFHCPQRVKLAVGMSLNAEVVQRQEGEDPYIDISISKRHAEYCEDITELAEDVKIVVYSADALEENHGKRSADYDWEIVCILCAPKGRKDRMSPLTMARNFLHKPGGTFSFYTSGEFAEAIYDHATNRGVKVK